MSIVRVLGLVMAMSGASGVRAESAVTFESLLGEMVDRSAVARWPEPAYLCRQASSYDRDSVAPDAPGWFANWDRSQFVRTEEQGDRTEYVMMDVEGPGAIVRIWGTWHGAKGEPFSNGTLRVYLDGGETPAIEGPIVDVVSGGMLAGAPMSQHVSPTCPPGNRAHNLYLPIPYADGCVVTYETAAPMDRGATQGGEALYYQINYRAYEAGTEVRTFAMEDLEEHGEAIAEVNAGLARPVNAEFLPLRCDARSGDDGPTPPAVIEVEGPGAISEIRVTVDAEDRAQALRSTVLEIVFDDERTVWCPVDAFFGGGYTGRATESWWTTVTEEGEMIARWVMPFERSAEVTLKKLTPGACHVALSVDTMPWEWDERSMHFHATWRELRHHEAKRGTLPQGEGAIDVNYVTVEGRGVYVGDSLSVFNTANAWWGEGDEKVWVDGETFPSHFGTGTEDYYGYAWCRPEEFAAPLHGQPTGAGNFTPGLSVNNRYRSLDAIPFHERLQFDMELWHWATTKVNYAPATFWYARPGAACTVAPDPEAAMKAVAREAEDVMPVRRVAGAIEGEAMTVKTMTGGVKEIQQVAQFAWSGHKQIWWRDGEPGDVLEFVFDVERAGRYVVIANLTKANDYGVMQLSVNGVNVEQAFDGYHESVTHEEVELGAFDLVKGGNTLTVTVIGSNPQAAERRMFGLDYVRLESAR
jgi:hypothetical protein